METYLLVIIIAVVAAAIIAVAGLLVWLLFCRESRAMIEDPEAPLIAHLHKNVRVQKRPSRSTLSESGLQLTHFYLRSSDYAFVKGLPEIGSRPEKAYSLVRSPRGEELLMALTPRSSYSVFAFQSESQQQHLRQLFAALKHPFIFPVVDIDFLPERDVLVTVRKWSPKGSLKDMIHKASPAQPYDKKYQSVSKQPVERVALYGRQILEALLCLRERGYPYGHLHTGNVVVEDGVCRVTDLENAFLNLVPERTLAALRHYPPGAIEPDALSFGLLLFELTFGYELDTSVVLSRALELALVPAKSPPVIKSLLEAILTASPQANKVSVLLQNPFFATAPIRDEHRFEIGMASRTELSLEPKARDMLKAVAAGFCLADLAAFDRLRSGPPPSGKRAIDPSRKKKKKKDGTGASAGGTSLGTSLGTTPSSVSTSALSARSPPGPVRTTTPAPAPAAPPRTLSASPVSTAARTMSPPPAKAPPKGPQPPPPPAAAAAPPAGAGRGALLSSIQGFSVKGLKKTVTVDKSKPRLG